MRQPLQVDDVIEMTVDMPHEGLRRGDRGRVLRLVNAPNGIYELVFSIYTDFQPIQLMLSLDEIRIVRDRVSQLSTRPQTGPTVQFNLSKRDADTLIDVLRHVQTDPIARPKRRMWCFNLANSVEQVVRRPNTDDINAALRRAETEDREMSLRWRASSIFPWEPFFDEEIPF